MARKIQPNEHDFRNWFLDNFDGWCDRVEIALGMNPGFPDLLAMLDIGLVPIELKIACLDDGRLWSKEVRPSQIAWHRRFYHDNRGRQPLSLFLFGVWSTDRWRAFAVEGCFADRWKDGFPLSDPPLVELSARDITESLERVAADWMD